LPLLDLTTETSDSEDSEAAAKANDIAYTDEEVEDYKQSADKLFTEEKDGWHGYDPWR
jgi:hypothetical protein